MNDEGGVLSEGEQAIAQVMVSDLFHNPKEYASTERDSSDSSDLDTNVKPKNGKVKHRRSLKGAVAGSKVPSHIPQSVSKSKAMRAVLASKCDESLHPIIRMGWKPLCSVTCNGLDGVFWGGHDRDVYVQCTSAPYAGLPLTDVSYGGCMMSCSHFERLAGRELSKKWKESIHVVEESRGSKMTVLKWLKEQTRVKYGSDIVGKQVWVCWCSDARFYHGTVIGYNSSTGKHAIKYSAGVTEELHLPMEQIDLGPLEPHVDSTVVSPTNRVVVPNPVWNQNSDVSMNMSMEELQCPNPAGPTALAGLVRARAQMQDESCMPKSPPPKRTLSPPEALLQRITETCIDAEASHAVAEKIEPPPSDTNPAENDGAAAKWMHHIALELDTEVQEAIMHSSMNSDMKNDLADHPSTQFQALLALATPDQRQGIFVAMRESYSFHAASDKECRRKLASLITVLLRQNAGQCAHHQHA